jgi:glycerophosphoryl diester phosphodiesterase
VTEVFAHRGVHDEERENTLGAFRAAVALGVDGVELDVRRTLEGALVVYHDPTYDGGIVAHLRADALPAYVPSLADALEVLRPVKVNVEIKNRKSPREPTYDDTGAVARAVLDCIGDVGATAVGVSCFDLRTCGQARDYAPEMPVAWLVSNVALPEALREANRLGLNAVNPHLHLMDTESQRLATALHLGTNVWTVNEVEDLVRIDGLGVTSVITDRPAVALDLLARRT